IFFFQAEDGIRDRNVTGVQTCALPILNVGRYRASWAAYISEFPIAGVRPWACIVLVSYVIIHARRTPITQALKRRHLIVIYRANHRAVLQLRVMKYLHGLLGVLILAHLVLRAWQKQRGVLR